MLSAAPPTAAGVTSVTKDPASWARTVRPPAGAFGGGPPPGMGGAARGGMPAGGPPGGMGRGGMPAMDINAMLERMPVSKLEDLKAGETIVVSSTKGAKSNEVT